MKIISNIINKFIPSEKQNNNISFSAQVNLGSNSVSLPNIHTAGMSNINTNLPISYTKIGEIDIPGLKDKASVFKLANGQKVIIAPKKGPTTVKTAYNVGSMNETDDIRGISHFIEHNLFNGSKELAPREYDKIVSDLGGYTNANTSYATTNYFMTLQLLKEDSLEQAIRLNALQTQFPTFPIEQLEKEKEPVKSEIDMYKDIPQDVTASKVLKDLFNVHTNSTDFIIGTKENINALTREKVMDYYNTWYTPDNAVTVITGDVDVNQTMALVSKYFNKPNDYSHINKRYSEPIKYNDSPKRTDIILPNATGAHISMGFAIPEGTSKFESDALDTLISLIALPNSRISKAFDKTGTQFIIEENKMQNQPDGAKAELIEIDTTEENIEAVLNTLYQEITYLANNPPSTEDLENIKKKRINSLNSLPEKGEILNNVLSDMALLNEYNYWGNTIANIQCLTPQDIQNAARKFLDLNKTAICVSHDKDSSLAQINHNYNAIHNKAKSVSFGAKKPIESIAEETQNIKSYTLPNNIKTMTIQGNPFAKSSLAIDIHTDEIASVPKGAVLILSELLRRGSLYRDKDKYDEIQNAHDLNIGLAAGDDGIAVSASFYDENMQETLALIKETLSAPNFTQQEFERAKNIVKDIIKSSMPDSSDKLYEQLFPNLKQFTSKEQALEDIEAMTLSDIINLYNTIFATAKVSVSMCGAFEQKPYLTDILNNEFSQGMPQFKPYTLDKPAAYYIYSPNTQSAILTQADERKQADITMAYTFKKSENIDDIAKIELLNTILGAGMSSRLFKDLREDKKLAYAVSSDYSYVKDTGILALNIGTTTDSQDPNEGSPENVNKSLEGFYNNINLIRTQNVSNEELENAKLLIKSHILNIMETNLNKSIMLSGLQNSYYNIHHFEELLSAIDRVTPDDIRSCANYIFKDKPVISIVASQKTLDEMNLKQ